MYCKPPLCKLWSEVEEKAFLVESKMYVYEYHSWYSSIFTPLKMSGRNWGDKISLKNPQLGPTCSSGAAQRTSSRGETDGPSSAHGGKWEGSPLLPRVGGCLVICSWQLWLKHAIHFWLLSTLLADWGHVAPSCFSRRLWRYSSDHFCLYTAQPNEHLPARAFTIAGVCQRSGLRWVKLENNMRRVKAQKKILLHLTFPPVV